MRYLLTPKRGTRLTGLIGGADSRWADGCGLSIADCATVREFHMSRARTLTSVSSSRTRRKARWSRPSLGSVTTVLYGLLMLQKQYSSASPDARRCRWSTMWL